MSPSNGFRYCVGSPIENPRSVRNCPKSWAHAINRMLRLHEGLKKDQFTVQNAAKSA